MSNRWKRMVSFLTASFLSTACFLSGCGAKEEVRESETESVRIESEESELEEVTEVVTTEAVTEAVTERETEAETETTVPETEEIPMTGFEMTMLDVGQGLSLLIEADGYTMIYDGGGKDTSSYVVSYLKQKDIEGIDLMIASHYDEDHLAGLLGVMNTMEVGTILCPEYEADSKLYESFIRYQDTFDIPVLYAETGDQYAAGNLLLTVLSPYYRYDNDNDNSVVLKLQYGDFSCILTGDAEMEAEADILENMEEGIIPVGLKSDLLVAGHHGSAYSSAEDFVKAIAPSVVWISCGRENKYGFPTKQALNTFKAAGADIYRTDSQGEIHVSTDGKEISYNLSPAKNWTPGIIPVKAPDKEVSESQTEGNEEQVTETEVVELNRGNCNYVLNYNSKKFHLPSCKSVDQVNYPPPKGSGLVTAQS